MKPKGSSQPKKKKKKPLRKIYTLKKGVNVRKENEKFLNIKNQNQNQNQN